ncbi:MAG TPA: hypothetical protein VL171_03645 [Verrucomicrobiae bacterium]|nr:hypothetical protein [Verrucomicrobiae bacterium]
MKRNAVHAILIPWLIGAAWLAAPGSYAITIGQGPAIGTDKRGTTWYQEFQDWSSNDVRAVSANDNEYKFNDQYDSSRDLIAFYSHDGGADGNYYFRIDFFDLLLGAENGNVDVYIAIATQPGDPNGQVWLPDFTDAQTDNPWRICVAVYDATHGSIYDTNWNGSGVTNNFVPSQNGGISYWRSDLDTVEFGIKRQVLLNAGWNGTSPLYFQVFTTRDGTDGGAGEISGADIMDYIVCQGCGGLQRDLGGGTGRLMGSIASTNTIRTAKYAAIAHANQSLGTRTQTQGHIYTKRPDLDLYPGFVRTIDTHEMLHVPLNMHLSGTLISSLEWARQDPSDATYAPGERDGPTFLARLKDFINNGTGSLIGGVYAENIMPYFEGSANQASIRAFNDLALSVFGVTTNDMKVMHVPERVIDSNTGWAHANPNGPLKGKPFDDIKAGGYVATYLDEVSHLHWWFYSDETNYFNACDCGEKWAGFGGCNDRQYHHKLHKINGVLTFFINDREDQEKFGPEDGGMAKDTRYTLLDKALQANDPGNPGGYAQITTVFDDWEAYAGNSFASATPNNNADQWHQTIRWAANHQWIQVVNLKDVVTWAQADTNWIYEDHGNVDGKTMQTYEWLKRASEQDYDHWYYGSGQEQSFFDRQPPTDPNASVTTAKKYGDMNTPGTLIRDSWDKVLAMPQGRLRSLAEWMYSAMIYETAWHDEDADPNTYHSRNYQFNFDVSDGCTTSTADHTPDNISGWALQLQGHVRTVGIFADAAQWVQDIKNHVQGATTIVQQKDLDDDPWSEYIMKNDKVYLCFKRWGARLVYAFVYDPISQDAIEVVGAPVADPAEETDAEEADNNRCSAFKDRYASTPSNHNQYVDLDYAQTPPIQGSNFWEFVSQDGQIRKRITLPSGRDAVQAQYALGSGVGTLYIRHGLGPNQWDLLHHGDTNLVVHTDSSYFYGLTNKVGGAAYAVRGKANALNIVNLPQAGYQNRELPLVEEVEVYNTGGATNFTTWLAFSPASANDIDGDGLSNIAEGMAGTDPENPDTDGDGMTDGYEVANGLNPLVNDASGDLDGDGMSNLREYLAGTAANNAASVFKISAVTPQMGGGFVVAWQSVPGKTYQLQSTDDLGTPFASLGGTITASGVTTSYLDSTATGQRFYKVKLIAP